MTFPMNSNKMHLTIRAEILSRNHSICFSFGTPDANGQTWMGVTKGHELVGEHIAVRRQVGPDKHERSRVEVVGRDCPVTGDVILILRAEGKSA